MGEEEGFQSHNALVVNLGEMTVEEAPFILRRKRGAVEAGIRFEAGSDSLPSSLSYICQYGVQDDSAKGNLPHDLGRYR